MRNASQSASLSSQTMEDAMTKAKDVKKGDDVTWKFGSGTGEGTVTQVHTDDVKKTIKGKTVTRHASEDKPAVEVKTDKGSKVLKSATEIKVK
jgi:hypothetical protein